MHITKIRFFFFFFFFKIFNIKCLSLFIFKNLLDINVKILPDFCFCFLTIFMINFFTLLSKFLIGQKQKNLFKNKKYNDLGIILVELKNIKFPT